jgi:LysR family transcriptional regulator, glycine cleavage system transcriptional activator
MKRRNLSLTALRAFEAAARLGGMSAASRELSVTHGAISRQVQHLERALEIELFAGPRTRPELTAAGRALRTPLTAAFDQIDAALEAIAPSGEAVLDISCLSTFLMRWLIPRLHRFRELHPQIEVRLQASSESGARQGRFDLAIVIDDANSRKTRRDVLFDEWLGVVATPHFFETRRLKEIGQILAGDMLQTATRLDAWDDWKRAAGIDSVRPTGAVFEHYYYTLEAVSAGLGACVAPWHLVVGEIQTRRLIAQFGFLRSGYLYATEIRPGARSKAERFRKWLLTEATAMPPPS